MRTGWLGNTRALLSTDAPEALERIAVAYFRLVNRHRVASYALIIAVGIGVFMLFGSPSA